MCMGKVREIGFSIECSINGLCVEIMSDDDDDEENDDAPFGTDSPSPGGGSSPESDPLAAPSTGTTSS